MSEPIPPIILPPIQDPQLEGEWLRIALHQWLDQEFIPEAVNQTIAQKAAQIYVRQRIEGENDLGSLVIAIVTEMQALTFLPVSIASLRSPMPLVIYYLIVWESINAVGNKRAKN